jgi:hypothetical protein
METLPHSGGLRVGVDGAQRGQQQPPGAIRKARLLQRSVVGKTAGHPRYGPSAKSASRWLQIEAQAARKPDQLVKEILRIVLSALACAIGFAFLAGVLPRGQGAGINRGVQEEYFEKLVQ